MNHFKGVNDQERFQNDLLNEIRKQTALLEQIAQLLQQKNETETVMEKPAIKQARRTKRSV